MALRKQNLFMPVGGLQTDIDDKVLPLGRVIDLENCYAVRKGPVDGTIEAVKRYGFVAVPSPANVAGQLGTHQGALVTAGVPLETLAAPTAAWTSAGGDLRPGLALTRTKVAGNAGVPDAAYGNGFYWVVWRDITVDATGAVASATVIRAAALDVATGHVAWSTAIAPAGGATAFRAWRVVYCNSKAVFVYIDNAGAIAALAVDGTTFATTTATTAAATALTTMGEQQFDITATATVVQIVYPNATPVVRGQDYNTASPGFTAWSPKDSGAADIPLDGSLGIMQDLGASGKIALLTQSSTQGLKVQWDLPATGATRQAATTYVIDAGFTTTVSNNIVGHTISSAATGEFVLCYDDFTGSPPTYRVYAASRVGGVITATYNLAKGCRLGSKTWRYGGENFVTVVHASATNGTGYVLRVSTSAAATATPHAKIGVRQWTAQQMFGCSSVVSPAPGTFTAAFLYAPRFSSSPSQDTYGVELATIRHGAYASMGITRESIGSMFSPGAAMGQYDGQTFAESGFAYSPEPPVVTPNGAGGAMTPSVTYWYSVVFARMDAQGRLWRSAPSVPVSVVMGGADTKTQVKVTTLRVTGWSNVRLEIYRGTAGNEVELQRVAYVQNVITADTVTYSDTMSDTTLASKEDLYTNGGGLGNDTPPGFSALVQAQNRMWGISADDPQALWMSKEFDLINGLAWPEDIAIDVRDAHGPMRALSVLDDRPVVFKDDMVYIVGGQGPDSAGNGGNCQATAVGKGIGCNNPQAVCETRDGVIFRSTSQRAGFFLLDRGGSIQYIGAPVQRYNSETITASSFLSSMLQARFYTASGRTLVYDLVTQTWSTFTGQPCSSSTSWAGVAVYASSASGHILREDLTGAVLTDDGAATTMLVGWPWLQVNQIRGYERFYRQQPTGEVSQASLVFRQLLYRNQETVPIATVGLTTPVGVINRELRYSAKLGALKVAVTDGGSTTGILRLTGITLVLGVKAGLQRVSAANRLG